MVPILCQCTSRRVTDMQQIPALCFGALWSFFFLLLNIFDLQLAKFMEEKHVQLEDCLYPLQQGWTSDRERTGKAGYRPTQDILLKVSEARRKKKERDGASQKENGQTASERMEGQHSLAQAYLRQQKATYSLQFECLGRNSKLGWAGDNHFKFKEQGLRDWNG